MPPTEEEEVKVLLDAEVAQEANKNIGLAMSGQLSADQVVELTEIDREYLRRTRACVEKSTEEDTLPDSPAAV